MMKRKRLYIGDFQPELLVEDGVLRAVQLPNMAPPTLDAHALAEFARLASQFRLCFDGTSDFARRVWQFLLQTKPGQTWTYGALAAELGAPGAARAVGNACASNPLLLVVPCHRVVARNGLGGFRVGLPWKKRLLTIEAAIVARGV